MLCSINYIYYKVLKTKKNCFNEAEPILEFNHSIL